MTPPQDPPTPLRCFTGALISGAISLGVYGLTSSIAQTFAEKPVATSSYLAANIAVAVRTLVVGGCALATFVFGFSALGLVALGIQQFITRSQSE
jgi:hypothetical protein